MMRPPTPSIRKHIQVQGVVQGVGFRPFVYTIAESLGLTGHVFNSSAGVTIEVEGGEHPVNEFLLKLRGDPPQLAEIAAISISEMVARGDATFSILQSRQEAGQSALVSPDAGTCDACWRDFGDPLNRRYGYAFTNCTHCGPRYTIIQDVPYDRASTTMSRFTMCATCLAEYRDPKDRRFHAQPNACADCGPSVALVPTGSSLSDCSFRGRDSLAAIAATRRLLSEGKIVAIKGLGGFLLACDATNEVAVNELRRRKHRPDKPFALMSRDINAVRGFCKVSVQDQAALLHQRRPVVILPRLSAVQSLSSVAPGNTTLGVMLPYTPLHYMLFGDSPESALSFDALVMTSGNPGGEPILTSNSEALQRLTGIADWFLLHNRDIGTRVDDSVVRTFEGRECILRRARGFAPQTVDLGFEVGEVLALGSESKNTFCLTKGRYAYLSQHIGDLDNHQTMSFFDETLASVKNLFKVAPQALAHDLHPGHTSTLLALKSPIRRKIAVQHHHAHIASCMAENHLRGKVIGVALDGTGYGPDGNVWGGEFLVADLAMFSRKAHFRYVPLPGEKLAVRQPWRMALSYLRDSFGEQAQQALPCFQAVPAEQFDELNTMLSRRLYKVQASSCGRLFDAVAALIGMGSEATFEGQLAIALEGAAQPECEERYQCAIHVGGPSTLDFRPMIVEIIQDIASGRNTGEISACFHNTLAYGIVQTCCHIRDTDKLSRVCLSGGTFQNMFLLERTVRELRRSGFEVFLQALVPANDGGISLGQAVIANELLRRGIVDEAGRMREGLGYN